MQKNLVIAESAGRPERPLGSTDALPVVRLECRQQVESDVTHGNEIEGMIQVTVGGHQGSGCLALVQRLADW